MSAYAFEPHAFTKQHRGIAWPICARCGLVRLSNPLTDWAVAKGCNNDDHPDAARMRRELVRSAR